MNDSALYLSIQKLHIFNCFIIIFSAPILPKKTFSACTFSIPQWSKIFKHFLYLISTSHLHQYSKYLLLLSQLNHYKLGSKSFQYPSVIPEKVFTIPFNLPISPSLVFLTSEQIELYINDLSLMYVSPCFFSLNFSNILNSLPLFHAPV